MKKYLKVFDWRKSFWFASATVATFSFWTQPASAIIFDWQFTNENGNVGSSTDVVSGWVEFKDAEVFPNATNVAATNLQITSVTGLPTGSDPFLGDGGLELNQNLLSSSQIDIVNGNSVSFNSSGAIIRSDLDLRLLDDNSNTERLSLRLVESIETSFLNAQSPPSNPFPVYMDLDSSTLTFTRQSASVPFEFSPTLGLLVVGGFWLGSRYLKHRQALLSLLMFVFKQN